MLILCRSLLILRGDLQVTDDVRTKRVDRRIRFPRADEKFVIVAFHERMTAFRPVFNQE